MEDLPEDILEKLRQLDLELEDGDITQKGYDKKKANLLNTILDSHPIQEQEEEELEDFGPEPSAADVDDFLDFLPSPTHSPKETKGASLMESNHVKMQQQQQQQQTIDSPRPMQAYRPPVPYNNAVMGSPSQSNTRPYMTGYQAPMTPQLQQRPFVYPNNRLPPQNMYRPQPNATRPIYNRPPSTPLYRPRPSFYRPPFVSNGSNGSNGSNEFDNRGPQTPTLRKTPSLSSLSSFRAPPNRSIKSHNKYENTTMVKSFQTVEPIPPAIPIDISEDHLVRQMQPAASRPVPFKVKDGEGTDLEEYETLADILSYRSQQATAAFTQIDNKGKETLSITYEKLALRAEKIAISLRDKKSNLQAGDRVGLYYGRMELVDFTVALMACLLAGVVAVPITNEDHTEIWFILRVAQIKLVLTTDTQHKAFSKQLKAKHVDWPKEVDWWPTQGMGSAKSLATRTRHTSLAYIEFSKSNTGELKGVSVSQQSLIKRCYGLAASMTQTVLAEDGSVVPHYDSQSADTVLTYLEPRQQLGLSLSVLLSIYAGNHTLLSSPSIIETPAVWVYLISKYKVTIGLANYPGMQAITSYCQQYAKEVKNFSKKVQPDLSSLRLLLIDSPVVQPDTDRYIHEQLLCPLAQHLQVTPVVSLPEHAGRVLALRDLLSDPWTCILDPDMLRQGHAHIATEGIEVGSHGLAHSTAIVDPHTHLLCLPNQIGEIWLESLGEEFWGIPALTDAVFRASPVSYTGSFVRTGLMGTVIEGHLLVLGPYEECIRQQRIGEPLGTEEFHMYRDLMAALSKQSECTLFHIYINQQYLPILVLESSEDELERKIEQATTTLLAYHGLRIFAAVAVPRNQLPRILKDGHSAIHALETKRQFLSGQLPLVYIQMDVDRTVFHVAASLDPAHRVWQTNSLAYERALSQQLISPRARLQHSGIEMIQNTLDERSNYDLSRFTNAVDIVLWRTSLYPDEIAFALMTHTTKSISWKKFNYQIAGLAHYLHKRAKCEKLLLILPFGLDLIRAIYACFVLGIVPVVCPQRDRIVHTVETLHISHFLTMSQDGFVRSKTFQALVKQRGWTEIQVEKASKSSKLLGPESGYSVRSEWTADKSRPALIVIQDEMIVYGHDTLLAQCRTQKLTCQLRYQRPLIVTGISGSEGLGLLHAAFCGVYVGCTTMLMPSFEFTQDPLAYLELVSRNKCSTLCANYEFMEFIQRINPVELQKISLKATQNLMLTVPHRTKPRHYERMARFLATSGLDRESINTVYSHSKNPMITTRSYMLIEPISFLADPEWLRQGIVRPLAQDGLLLHDSGIVPTNTMIAIVNPETHTLCPTHVLGEIWVSSDSNCKNATESVVQGGDPRIKYMRTGDLGFLWDVHRQTPSGPVEEGQCLYVLGPLDQVIMFNGLMYFALDLEETVEQCHSMVVTEGCVVIQADLEIVVIVTVRSHQAGLSIIPLIIATLLEKHALLVDTVVTTRDSLSKNGEKRRKQALSMYTNKKLSAIHVSRVKNQHRPIQLPPNIQDDNASVLSQRLDVELV